MRILAFIVVIICLMGCTVQHNGTITNKMEFKSLEKAKRYVCNECRWYPWFDGIRADRNDSSFFLHPNNNGKGYWLHIIDDQLLMKRSLEDLLQTLNKEMQSPIIDTL